jgi:hypothetical protein
MEPYEIQINYDSAINLKYNILNIAINKLVGHCQYVGWLDLNVDLS